MKAQVLNVSCNVVSQLTRACKAQQAVDQLSLNGYEVVSIDLNSRTPVIWIAASDLCGDLQGVQIGSMPTPNGVLRVFCAPYEQCQVQWQVLKK